MMWALTLGLIVGAGAVGFMLGIHARRDWNAEIKQELSQGAEAALCIEMGCSWLAVPSMPEMWGRIEPVLEPGESGVDMLDVNTGIVTRVRWIGPGVNSFSGGVS